MKKERKEPDYGARITFRLSTSEQQKLSKLLANSTSRSISELIRKSLFEGKVIVVTYDTSLDKVMEELSGIRKEIQAIGININQVTRRFHTEENPEARLFHAMEIGKLYQQTDLKVTELFEIISKLSQRWLPGL